MSLAGLALGLIVVVAGASCVTVGRDAAASASTLMAGWETHFKLDWAVEPEGANARVVRGYIASLHGQHAEPVRILARALDGSGVFVGSPIAWIPGGVSGLGRAYFAVPPLPGAERVEVT